MNESRYNFYLNNDEDNIHLIYNAFKNTLISDDDCKVQNFLKQCKNNIEFNPKYLTKNEYNDLVSSGIIISDETNEKQLAIDRNKKRLELLNQKKEILSLVIAPTLRCNFKCYYCFESLNTRKNDEFISTEVQNDIINFIRKSIEDNHIKRVNITWYGGEPLILPDTIFSMQKQINELCNTNNIRIDSSIITNGILLSPQVCDLLYGLGIKRVQITIDGPEQIHNKRRYYPVNPSNNYNQILNSILKSNNNIRFQIRVNIDETNKDYIFDLIDDLIRHKILLYKKNVSIYTAPVLSNNITDLPQKEFFVLQDQIRYYLMKKFNEINYYQISKVKLKFLYPQMGGELNCGYGVFRNSWVISYNGDVFRCWESVGQEEHKVGSIKDLLADFGYSIFERIKLDSKTFEIWDCFDCKFFPICISRCPWNFTKNKRCTGWKNALEYRLLNQYKLFLNDPKIYEKTPFNMR